eukprot:CAMPEP_0113682784 /NCGR_PEP_ID=MMETSP0038_2-20120614/12881_1 /TAXON_ID=2898 /ORGANISM="Cryptomonas paramecium" /LENGTH=727 /DNA_ID=CAMNT_0000601943 /DNA_START=210 /DNA_END=2393 /DNA_ORIENTATION=- /assembly_acc=CAM_ASM_000170
MAFNPRSVVPELGCELASRNVGAFSWIFRVCRASNDEIFEQCGLDAIAFIRLVQLGLKVSIMGCLTAIFVMPTYYHAPETGENWNVTDPLDKCSIANVNSQSDQMYATVVASYLIFGFMIYLVHHEFRWYISCRHRVMGHNNPENHTVFLRNIPMLLKSRKALHGFFGQIFDDVLEVVIPLDVSKIDPLVATREAIAQRFEHATNIFMFKGKRPEHSASMLSCAKVDSITAYAEDLSKVNQQVADSIAELNARYDQYETTLAAVNSDDPPPAASIKRLDRPVRNAAFVSFRSIRSATIAKQTVLCVVPFALQATAAPAPKDVCWGNVGIGHRVGQLSSVLASFGTTILCVLWTVPVAFVATFTQIDSLITLLPFLRDASHDFPMLDQVLAQVAPIALIVLSTLLPVALAVFARMEGHVAETAVQASLFSKLTFFKVVQTFFVSAISGSVFAALMQIAADPVPIILDILGRKLPAQASFFMQLMLVQSFVGMGLELLRPVPCAIAAVRRLLGPNVTPKERAAPWMGLNPLSSPGPFDQPNSLSSVMLMYVILLAYAVLSPVTCFIMAFCFGVMTITYRNQFINIYDPRSDTGGLMWPRAIQAAVMCLVVAELMVVAVLSFKKAAGPSPLMFPLLVITVLFYRYLGQQHYRVGEQLPLEVCARADTENAGGDEWNDCAQGKYVQPALKPFEMDVEALLAQRPPEVKGDVGSACGPTISITTSPVTDFND